jgi:hypothetical protein
LKAGSPEGESRDKRAYSTARLRQKIGLRRFNEPLTTDKLTLTVRTYFVDFIG